MPSSTLAIADVAWSIFRPQPVDAAEQQAATLVGREEVILFASGRAALAAIVVALGGSLSRVAIPAYTCVAVLDSLRTAGATPVWVDVQPSGLVSADAWASVRADLLMSQDTYGFPAPVPTGLVIRDASHRVDLLADRSATVAFTSFEHSKWLSSGHGGLVVTDDAEFAARVREVRETQGGPAGIGRGDALITLLFALGGRGAYRGRLWGAAVNRLVGRLAPDRAMGFSPDELAANEIREPLMGRPPRTTARLINRQLARAGDVATHRRAIVRLYDHRAGIDREAEPLLRYPMTVDDPDRVTSLAQARGWALGRPWFVSPLHPLDDQGLRDVGYDLGTAPTAERLAEHVLNLPTHVLVRPAEAEELIALALECGGRPIIVDAPNTAATQAS